MNLSDEIDVPPFFLCPISLEIMKDPVTISTGITYDRDNIEKWVFSGKNKTCPLTKQPISDFVDLTPNHTLRRLIQAWCTMNASHGIERIPTPKPPINKIQITKLLNDAYHSPHFLNKSLKQLKSIASGSETNKRCMEAAGAVEFLASVIKGNTHNNDSATSVEDEALSILHDLHVSETGLKTLLGFKNGEFIESLTRVMQNGIYESRVYAVTKAVEAGAVSVLIELLLDCKDRKPCEMMLVLLESLCQCADGRAELLSHGAGLAIVSKKILRVSILANDRAVRILLFVSRFSATPGVVQEMLKLGVVAKLCLILQVDSGNKVKEIAREILKLHARVWRDSSCIPSSLLSSYPPYV
ncbi:putative aminoacyltransferase, E1 ubiquitin-activating enzyme [Lupinus albus]|uniref:U-box domain-containing protein n=1 Tax=Lupinus albus TaxID=3870 RepID=A0A6A4MMX2_LUPAL|nr:putative aminoacyltransferase, E1 ubiquitin-activating enzyme [Lupinus albus]